MSDTFKTDNPELEALFERYRSAPGSHVFAPLADACRKAGMFEEAIEICEKGVSTHPRYASGFVVRGKCYYDLGNSDQAEASFEKVLQLDANNLVALKYMGLILAERGEAEAARTHFEHILALDPDDREIAAKLEEITLREAHEILDDEASMRGLDDDDAEATSAPDVAVTEPDADDADLTETDDASDDEFVPAEIHLGGEDTTTDVLATMTLAEIYASQGYRSKALKIFRELLSADPGNETVKARLRDLGETRVGDGAEPVERPDTTPPAPAVDKAPPAPAVDKEPPAPAVKPPAAATPAARETAPAPDASPTSDPVAAETRAAGARDASPKQKARGSRGKASAAKARTETPPDDTSVSQFKRWLDNLNR